MKLILSVICICLSFFSLGYATLSDDTKFYSQASQDKFIYTLLYDLLDKQDTGYYLEIGASDPIHINNTYFFEKNLQWEGVSLDIAAKFVNRWDSIRENPLLIEDATQTDYVAILEPFPYIIDYLSLDIDRNYDLVLQKIPLDEYIFKVMTIEHDFYRFGDKYRKKEREILNALGYHLLCSDVSNEKFVFEDWWIHPSAFPPEIFEALASLDLEAKEHTQIIQAIQNMIYDNSQD